VRLLKLPLQERVSRNVQICPGADKAPVSEQILNVTDLRFVLDSYYKLYGRIRSWRV